MLFYESVYFSGFLTTSLPLMEHNQEVVKKVSHNRFYSCIAKTKIKSQAINPR